MLLILQRTRPRAIRGHRLIESYKRNRSVTLTIKAEHKDRLWERRSPLTPDDASRLINRFGSDRLKVQIESSPKRIFDDQSYAKVGAEVVEEGRGNGEVIIAVKEISIDHLPPRNQDSPLRTYCFFSHTHKGQSYNVPLLNRMVESGHQFIDWELLVDPETQVRQVSFGRLAGVVGAGEALSGYGILALKQGYSTPFLNLPRPYTFRSTNEFFEGLDLLKNQISREGYRGPMVSVIVTGWSGRVGGGAVETLDQAGIQWVESLVQLRHELSQSKRSDKNYKIIGYKLQLKDHLYVNDDMNKLEFDRSHYNDNPHRYLSNFNQTIAPYTTLLINSAYWSNEFPRLLSNSQFSELIQSPNNRLRGITDISCDFNGGLEFVSRATTIESPYAFLKSDPANQKKVIEADWSDPRALAQLISIEILPSELPRDASIDFSAAILPYLADLIESKLSDSSTESNSLIKSLENATICKDGKLAPKHQGLSNLLSNFFEKSTQKTQTVVNQVDKVSVGDSQKSVAIFGSGLVAKPAIQVLLSDPNVKLTIAAKLIDEAKELIDSVCKSNPENQGRIELIYVDAEGDPTQVSDIVKQADIVLSLLPATIHPLIAKPCLDHSVNLVTASYVSPAMASFDETARSKGLVFLNELGLDPGIDHMTAVRLINRLKKEYSDWRIRSFVSFCGGLPEESDGLLGYKFSWSPRGVLEAMGNPARFKLDGKAWEKLMSQRFRRVGEVMFNGKFGFGGPSSLEGIANRDSLGYIERYGLDSDDLETMMRGTLRYEGFCEVMEHLRRIGLVRKDNQWDQVIERLGGQVSEGAVRNVLKRLGLLPGSEGTELKGQLSKFPSEAELKTMTPIEILCKFLSDRLAYGVGERDLVLLSHEIRIEEDSRSGEERWIKSELMIKGDQDSTAMAKTVGSPIGIGALKILRDVEKLRSGTIRGGVMRPTEEVIWKDVLKDLEDRCNIKMVEREYRKYEDGIVVEVEKEKDGKVKTKKRNGLEALLKLGVKNWKKPSKLKPII
ncbi:Saccharopine dehydrogenase-domain-containing protein [Phakopsora pachyrhizi]|nr:Saccharopine dehydrogenase-domain-containing protein [Phakopsora pachyrhizi]